MIEIASDRKTRNAYRAAHCARGQFVTGIWAWLTGSVSSG